VPQSIFVVALREQRFVSESLERLARALEALEFGPDTADLSSDRARIAGTIRSYLLPRAVDSSAPVTVVFAGPTGSGKSTLVNSLAGVDASRTGVIRPTTKAPLIVARHDAADRYREIGGVACDVVTADVPIFDAMVLVDAPDIDSTSTSHRVMAEALIDNADLVVFITSALRYADDVPWQILRRAISRGTPVIHVLNRVGSASAGASVDFRSRLAAAGFDDALITVPEHHLAPGGQRVPAIAVNALRERLTSLVANRDGFADEVFTRVLRATVTQVTELARAITGLQDQTAALDADLSALLTGRVSDLSLAGIGDGLYPPAPGRATRITGRRWTKRSELAPEHAARLESEVTEKLVSLVRSDVRRWLVAERETLRERNIDPGPVISGTNAAARSAAEGWIDFVTRIATEFAGAEPWLGEAVLIHAATADDLPRSVDILFGEDGPVVVERARRELVGRLEVVFELAGRLVVEGLRGRFGNLDDEELRSALAAVTSSLPPVYA